MKVANELKIDPPIQDRNCRSTGPTTFIFVPAGTKPVTSFDNLYGVPGSIVVPPLKTILVYRSFLTSKSHFMID